MTGTVSWLGAAATWIGLAALICGGGMWLTLLILADAARQPAASVARAWRVLLSCLALTATAWLTFLLSLAAWFPRIMPDVPPGAAIRSVLILAAGALLTLVTVGYGRRNVRNITFAASILCATLSCMLFISMQGVVEPANLAYDLVDVLCAMLAASLLCAAAIWQNGGTTRGRAVAAVLIGGAILALIFASLAAILPFQDWQAASADPGNLENRPLAVVFASELVVVLLLALAGSGVDRQSAARAARETERLRQLWDATFEGLLIHRDGIVLDANAAFCRLVALPANDIVGHQLARFVEFPAPAPGEIEPGAHDITVRRQDQTTLPAEVLRRAISYRGRAAEIIALRDITERRAAEAQIRFLAHHDVLTGLPNRFLLHDIAERLLATASGGAGEFIVLCLDLDRFKAVNDTFGHHAGDLLLKQVAGRIGQSIRDCDTAARVGGDEFVLLLREERGALGGLLEGAGTLARRLIERLSAPYDIAGQPIGIGASAGMAAYPQDGTTIQALINNADLALYHAKVNGRGSFSFFNSDMDTRKRERRSLEQDLAAAIAAGELTLAFQPLFATGGGVVGFEALTRWMHPRRGLIPPGIFIPLAEEAGLIVQLGSWALETACRTALSWRSPCRIAVNVSPRQFRSGDLPDLVADILARTGLAATRLELEITEGVFIDSTSRALSNLDALHAQGVRIALDDFGTGYSSLSYLHRFPFDTVKIDRSFIERITEDHATRSIVSAIVALCHRLDLQVTAEGVETAAQLAQLRAEACDFVQGFLLGAPMTADQATAFLAYPRPELAA